MNLRVNDRKRVYTKPSYRFAVAWIALNDGPGDDIALNSDAVSEQVSVLLIADLFGCDPLIVAVDVVSCRLKSR